MALIDPDDSTQVASPLTPEGDNPTHLAQHGDGGIATVTTIADRDALIAAMPDRCEVKLVHVLQAGANGIIYRVETDGTVFPDPAFIAGLTGTFVGGAWIKSADILPQTTEVISNKVFRDPPNNTIIESATSDQTTIEVFVRSAFPEISLDDGVLTATAFLSQAADGGHYEGNVPFTVQSVGSAITINSVNADGVVAGQDNVTIAVQAGPELLSLSFTGAYPGSQTELKAGDTYDITGTTDVAATHVEVQDVDAGTLELLALPGAPTTSFTVTMTIADRGTTLQALEATVRARDAGGAFGTTRTTNQGGGSIDGTDLVNLNNLFPGVSFGGGITYPGGQAALKGTETADVANAVTNFDTITYDDPTAAELTIPALTTFANPKTVTRLGGTYNISTPNFRITANRAANNSTTVSSTIVQIASVAAVLTVTEPAARLRSGGNNGTAVQDHTITVTSDQNLSAAPTLAADGGGGDRGVFQGGSFAGGLTVWTRDLRVDETVPSLKGVFAWGAISGTNLAGLVTSAITGDSAYTLGGFVARTLTFLPFATTTALDTEVVDFSKLQAGIFTSTNQTALKQAISTPPSVTDGYTIDATGVNPTSLIWLDTAAASANSSGTATITNVEEVV